MLKKINIIVLVLVCIIYCFLNDTLALSYNSKMWIEDPVVGSENYEKLKVRGWALSEDKDSQVMIYIDGKRTEGKINRSERNDVTNKISGYGGKESNPMPGFESTDR